MNDAEWDAQRARVEKLHEWWAKALGLNDWRIKRIYERRPGPSVGKDASGAMRCWCRWQYKCADITVYVGELPALSDNELEQMYLHELMHVALNETEERAGADRHQERVATQLAQSFMWVRDAAKSEQEVEANG